MKKENVIYTYINTRSLFAFAKKKKKRKRKRLSNLLMISGLNFRSHCDGDGVQ
jgi:hypothetical protein